MFHSPGGVQGQAGQDLEQHSLVEGVPCPRQGGWK